MNENSMEHISPIQPRERFIILDVLRGIALLGICLANFPEFSLYTFQKSEVAASMPTAGIDRVVRYLQYLFIDGKFYTLFSLLFGIGFSIILSNAQRKGISGFRIFYRRMLILALIGFIHLLFIWSGDILFLYALLGMLLPLFRKFSDKNLLWLSAGFVLFPIVVDALTTVGGVNLSEPAVRLQQYYCDLYGITDDNFGIWLRDADSYGDVFRFLVQGAFVRVQEFIDGHRALKVMGLFILGYYIGRNGIYANLTDRKEWLMKVCRIGFLVGFPTSALYAWSAVNHYPAGVVFHSLLYAVSVVPMGLAYITGICLLFHRKRDWRIWEYLAVPGRMALTNYIGQSVSGMLLFYGIGLGLGASIGLSGTEVIAVGVFLFQIAFSTIWLHYFQFGPLEWIWRMLTYGRWLSIFKRAVMS